MFNIHIMDATAPPDNVTQWLRFSTRGLAQAVAARAVLRASSALRVHETIRDDEQELVLRFFRGSLIAWAAAAQAGRDTTSGALGARLAADERARTSRDFGIQSIMNAVACATASAEASAAVRTIAVDAVHYAADATAKAGRPDFWRGVWADHVWMEEHQEGTASALLAQPLWMADRPDGLWNTQWNSLRARLLAASPNWAVWTDWYDRRLEGHDSSFDIPGDASRTEDRAILARLAASKDRDFWSLGPGHVNSVLQTWIEEGRSRALNRMLEPQSPLDVSIFHGEIARKLAEGASPIARIVNAQLDAVPNTRFDRPAFSGDLANLPSELRAYVTVLKNSLPRNVSREIAPLLDGYDDELLVRGTRPILNILKAMASSLRAELWMPIDDEERPDLWELRAPQEWGPGAADLWRSFFEAHLRLIKHFPLDPQREALIARTPIDEVAASGAAMTHPVDAVTELIVELGRQGFATDNIVRIVEAHQLYTRSVAGLPPVDSGGDAISPKRRHVLNTIGFWVSLLGVLSSSAALADSATVNQLIDYLRMSAAAWLKFIIGS